MDEKNILKQILETPDGATTPLSKLGCSPESIEKVIDSLIKKYNFITVETRKTTQCIEHSKSAVFVEIKGNQSYYHCPSGHRINILKNESTYVRVDNDALLQYFLTNNKLTELTGHPEKTRLSANITGCKIIRTNDLPVLLFLKRTSLNVSDVQIMHSLSISEFGKIAGIVCLTNKSAKTVELENFLQVNTFGTTKLFDINDLICNYDEFHQYLKKIPYLHQTFQTAIQITNDLGFEVPNADRYKNYVMDPKLVLAEINNAGEDGDQSNRYEEIAGFIFSNITKTTVMGQQKIGCPLPDTISYFDVPTSSDAYHCNILALDAKSGFDKNFQRRIESTDASKMFDYIQTIDEALNKHKRNWTVYGSFLLPEISTTHLINRVKAIGEARKRNGIKNNILVFTNKGLSAIYSLCISRAQLHKDDQDLKHLKEQLFTPLSTDDFEMLSKLDHELKNKEWDNFKDAYLTAKDNGVLIISPEIIIRYTKTLKHKSDDCARATLEKSIIEIAKEKAPRSK